MNAQLHGAWVCPNGDIHFTDNIESHIKVINELNIKKTLELSSKKNIWNKDEIQSGLNFDLAYIAMKEGYIRITGFQNQFSVEYSGNAIKDIQMLPIYEVYKYLQEISNEKIDTFIAEVFMTNNYKIFYDYKSLITDLCFK